MNPIFEHTIDYNNSYSQAVSGFNSYHKIFLMSLVTLHVIEVVCIWILFCPVSYVLCRLILYLFRSLPLLLPAVENGIFNDNWRIRQSSVELLGDLLFKVLIPIVSWAIFSKVEATYYLISHLGCWNLGKSTSWGWQWWWRG